MEAVTSIDLFNALKGKVGEKEAKMLTEYMDYKAADSFDKVKSQLATKEDLSKLELATKDSISKLELSTKDSISSFKLEMKDLVSGAKMDIIKWMFIFFSPIYIALILFIIQFFLKVINS